MRTARGCLFAIMIGYIAIISLSGFCAAVDDIAQLMSICNGYEDPHMDFYDLAFFLAVHGYNVVPAQDCVELNQNGTIYRLIPNGEEPGLCTVYLLSVFDALSDHSQTLGRNQN
jgi:hypothetical protein